MTNSPWRLALAGFAAALCTLCILSAARVFAQSSRRARATEAYQSAQRLRATLEAHPGSPAASYERVVRAFQLVYRIDPGCPKTPAALSAAAQIYEEMAQHFASDRYHSKAIEAYQFLAAQYPHSTVAEDAAFAAAEIYRTEIENPAEALAAYEQFLTEYPRSRHADAARLQIRKINQQLAAWHGAAPAPPRTSTMVRAASTAHPEDVAALSGAPHSGGIPKVESIRHWTGPNYTRVVVGVNRPVAFNAMHLSHPPRLVFDLLDSQLSPSLAQKVFPVENGFLERVRVAQFKPGVTRLVLDVPQIEDYSVFSLPNPFRLIIDIHGAKSPVLSARRGEAGAAVGASKPNLGDGVAPSQTADLNAGRATARSSGTNRTYQPLAAAAAAAPVTPVVSPPSAASLGAAPQVSPTLTRALGLKIRRIVIDPGHGGKDTGTIGPTGLEEKNLVLDVALRLRKLIKRRMGCQVIMTRSTDVFVPLEERTAIANEYGADLFISIHANSSHDPSARGVEVYYLNFTSDPEALQVAARENASSTESVYQLQSLIKKIVLTEKIDESRRFASIVDTQLVRHLDAMGDTQRNRGVKKAPFVVLIGANMPSILAEISFVSNPHDERMLRRGSYREKIAVGLYDGIARYAASLGTIHVAERSASSPVSPAEAREAKASSF